MKKIFSFINFVIIVFFLLSTNVLAQNTQKKSNNKVGWTTSNPFKTDVFIENYGQFDNWAMTPEPIKYAINNCDKVFFTQHGLTFRIDKVEKLGEEEREKMERETGKEPIPEIETYYVNMQWEGSNPDAVIEAGEQTDNYYTFGEKGYEDIQAKGYKKLLYKNLYNGIDVEYTIPENKGGIKYKLIVHPEADISMIKMRYTGDVERIETDKAGNILIKTPVGDITDHAPQSFYEDNTKSIIPSLFQLNENTVSFKVMKEHINTSKIRNPKSEIRNFIIDPWTTTPDSLTTDYAAYDIDYDNFGNVYVSGGTAPYKLAKYTSTGIIKWTFTNPNIGWGSVYNDYSKFCIIRKSGTVFIGEGLERLPGSGPRVMRIRSKGTLQSIHNFSFETREIWVMFYNKCSGQLVGFGGGTQNGNNLQLISDTNMNFSTNSEVKNFNAYSTVCNDVASAVMDDNGDFYALMSQGYIWAGLTPVRNHLQKSLYSQNYNIPLGFDVNTGYDFYEASHSGILGLDGITVRANALALNSSYLYSYDGKTIKAWNKTYGTMLDSVIVNPMDTTGGRYRTHEGIAVDECNNVYVGGTDTVHVYNFNDSVFTQQAPITAGIWDEVYDIKVEQLSGILYICGLGFVTAAPVASCSFNQLQILNTTVDNCSGSAGIDSVSGGTPPYYYHWSNGATTSSVTGLAPGIYTITVTDSSCYIHESIDTIIIDTPIVLSIGNDTAICTGDNVTLTATGGNKYTWNTTDTTAIITVSPTSTTTYTVTGTDIYGCTDTDDVIVAENPLPPSPVLHDTTICLNETNSITLNVINAGLYIYEWYDSLTGGTLLHTGSTYTVNDITTEPCFYIEAINYDGCRSLSRTVACLYIGIQPTANFIGEPISLCQDQTVQFTDLSVNAVSWHWTFGVNEGESIVQHPKYTYRDTGLYTIELIVTSTDGCTDTLVRTDYIEINVCNIIIPNVFTPNGDGINDNFVITGVEQKIWEIVIYNRWGIKVYENSHYKNEWDGDNQSDGVYYYIVKNYEKGLTYTGIVTLLR